MTKKHEDEPELEIETQHSVPEVTPLAATPADNHKANVMTALGTAQGASRGALLQFQTDHNYPNLAAAVVSADKAFYKAVVASAQANGQPMGGFMETAIRLGAL